MNKPRRSWLTKLFNSLAILKESVFRTNCIGGKEPGNTATGDLEPPEVASVMMLVLFLGHG